MENLREYTLVEGIGEGIHLLMWRRGKKERDKGDACKRNVKKARFNISYIDIYIKEKINHKNYY